MNDFGVMFKDRNDARRVPPMGPGPSSPWPRRKPVRGGDQAEAGARTGRPAAPSASPASEAGFSGSHEYEDPVVGLVVQSNELLVDLVDRQREHFERKIAGLETQLVKMFNENTALRLILENLRITQRGERGVDGDRGPPGRDGRDGVGNIGPRGEPGPKGADGPRIVSWVLSDDDFSVVPVLSDGSNGPTLYLRGMFEAYANAVEWVEDIALVEAAHRSREQIEAETEASRWGSR